MEFIAIILCIIIALALSAEFESGREQGRQQGLREAKFKRLDDDSDQRIEMKSCAPESIRATTAILRHFRAFIRSDCSRMIDPYSGWHRIEINKKQAQRKLTWLVDVAINRRAGIPDFTPSTELLRDSHRLDDIINKRTRVYQFETRLCTKRFSRLLSSYTDD